MTTLPSSTVYVPMGVLPSYTVPETAKLSHVLKRRSDRLKVQVLYSLPSGAITLALGILYSTFILTVMPVKMLWPVVLSEIFVIYETSDCSVASIVALRAPLYRPEKD